MEETELYDYDKIMNDFFDNEIKLRNRALDFASKNTTKEFYNDLLQYIEDSDYTEGFEITKEAPDDKYKQDEDFEHLKFSWVNQYCNGGITGDDFAGECWVKINNEYWLTFTYRC